MKSELYQAILLISLMLSAIGQGCSENNPVEQTANIAATGDRYIQFKAVPTSININTGKVTFKGIPEVGIINDDTQLIDLDGNSIELEALNPDDGVLVRGIKLAEDAIIISLMMEVVEI
ncbi:MAG: hypothetical protein AB1746_16330 [Candidatus Zixiibacteriota bacterium]